MIKEEALNFLKISDGINDFADENSGFHVANTISFKEEYLNLWLEAQKIVARYEAIQECIDLSDKIEASAGTEFNEWRAFKGFRNTLYDKLNKNE